MKVYQPRDTPAGMSVSGSVAPPNTPLDDTEPFPSLTEPALAVDDSAGSEQSARVQEPNLIFPSHYHGHFLGVGLENLSQAVLGGYNFPPAPGPSSLHPSPSASGIVGHSRQSSAPFTVLHNNSLATSHSDTMPGLPYYPPSFDGTPHHVNPNHSGQVNFPTGPTYNSSAAQADTDFGRFEYDASAFHVNSDFSHLTYPSTSNFNLNSNFNPEINMMPRSAPGIGQPTFAYPAAQQYGQLNDAGGYGNAGHNFNFGNPGASTYPVNQMPYDSSTNSMNNKNNMNNMYNPGSGHTAGFLESGFSSNAMVSSTQPPANTYIFGPSNPPPFIDLTRFVWPSSKPVVKVTNIPFNVSKDELAQFIRRNFLPHGNEYSDAGPSIVAVHIIMELTNAKTQDCFIELADINIKRVVMDRYNEHLQSSFPPKIGQRHISIEDSGQGELMKEIFPRAKCIAWGNVQGFPVKTYNLDQYSSGFKGFLTDEELRMLVRYTQDPARNPYGTKCPQRTYETMIMTLNRYPWASPYHTFEDREKLWSAYLLMLQCLVAKVAQQGTIGLNSQLLETFIVSGINCPAFAGWQKNRIVLEAHGDNAAYGLSSFAEFWPFECLSIPAGVSDQDINNWLELLTTGMVDKVQSTGARAWYRRYLVVHLDAYDRVVFEVLPHAINISFRDMANDEYEAMIYLIKRGWAKWFEARGLDSNTNDMVIPDQSSRMDVALDHKMHAVGVYADSGVLGSKANAINHLPNLIEDDGRPMSPGIDPILAEEDAIAREAAYGPIARVPSPTLSEVLREEDARAAAASPEPVPSASAVNVAQAPIQLKDPFQDSTKGGTSNIGTLVFGQMGAGMIEPEDASDGSASIVPAAVDTQISTASRTSQAIPIRIPEDRQISTAAKTKGTRASPATSPKSKEKDGDKQDKGKEDQDPIGTPSHGLSAFRSYQVDVAAGTIRFVKNFRAV